MRTYYHEQRRPQPRRSSGTKRRVLLILGISVGLAFILNQSRQTDRYEIEPPPIDRSIGRMSATRLQDYAADRGAVGGLLAAEKALDAMPEAQRDDDDPLRTVRVNVPASEIEAQTPLADRIMEGPRRVFENDVALRIENVKSSAPDPIRERALQDAIRVARDELAKELRAMNPPIDTVPSTREIRARYLVLDSVSEIQPSPEVRSAWERAGLDPDRVWVEINVELTSNDLRELRTNARLASTTWIGIGAMILLTALTAFLRFDTWTRGYLTKVLAVAAIAIAAAGVALLYITC